MENTKTIKSLNELLQGEYMAVESFNNFISKLEDENVKQTFKEVQKQHRENIDKKENKNGRIEKNFKYG